MGTPGLFGDRMVAMRGCRVTAKRVAFALLTISATPKDIKIHACMTGAAAQMIPEHSKLIDAHHARWELPLS